MVIEERRVNASELLDEYLKGRFTDKYVLVTHEANIRLQVFNWYKEALEAYQEVPSHVMKELRYESQILQEDNGTGN